MSKNIVLKNLPIPTSLDFSKSFRKEYLNFVDFPELLKQSVLVTNILFQIVSDLRDNSFYVGKDDTWGNLEKKQKNQLKLELWTDFVDSEKHELKAIYKSSLFLKNKDKGAITSALEFLKNFNKEIFKEGKLTTSSGLIKDWYFHDNTGNFEITISQYWATKIVSLGQFNPLDLEVLKSFKNTKQRFFILYLMELKKFSGTSKNFDEFLKAFDLEYNSPYELMRGFLAPMKSKLDNKLINDNWLSFNFFLDPKKNNSIRIVPYDVKPSLEKINLAKERGFNYLEDEKTFSVNSISYKLRYLKRRHLLSPENMSYVKNNLIKDDLPLFEINYKKFLSLIKKENLKAQNLSGQNFIDKFNNLIE